MLYTPVVMNHGTGGPLVLEIEGRLAGR